MAWDHPRALEPLQAISAAWGAENGIDVQWVARPLKDFEDQPLHGTFLIDKAGKIRWQDISYQPFTEPEFLLKEAKRLLGTGQTDIGITSK